MAGLTSEGLTLKSLLEIRDDMAAQLKVELGPDLQTGDDSVLGHLLGVEAAALVEVWELLQGVVDAFSPDAAQGAALDQLCAIVGVTRQPATRARGTVVLLGTPGVLIPAGKLVKSSVSGVVYALSESVIIGGGGTVTASIAAEEPGAGRVEGLDLIITPVPGWTGLGVSVALEDGEDGESDTALRLRREQSLQITGAAADAAIRARILQLPGIEAALVISNRTSSALGDGQPPKSYRLIVWPAALGADTEEEIARVLWEVQPAGIESWGTEVYSITDALGIAQEVAFDYAVPVLLYVRATLTTNSRYPQDGLAQVRAAIRAVFEGLDEDAAATAQQQQLQRVVGAGLSVGDDVTTLRLACAVATVPGVVSATFEIDTDNPPVATGDYAIGVDGIARLAADAYVVTT